MDSKSSSCSSGFRRPPPTTTHSHGRTFSAVVIRASTSVAAVETDEARLGIDAAIGQVRHADLDRLSDRFRVPGTRHTIGIETEDEDPRS